MHQQLAEPLAHELHFASELIGETIGCGKNDISVTSGNVCIWSTRARLE